MSADPARSRSAALLLIIAYVGFISLGLPDTVIGVAWPSVRDTFARQQAEISWIFFGAGATYFLSSLFTGRLLAKFGVGLLLAGSSVLVAGSMFGYSAAPVWVLFASCALLHGLGSGAIDSGLNHYVAHHFSARHMTWLHAFYSIGATLGPLIMTAVLVRSGSWRAGYFTVGSILFLLTLLFVFTRRRWDEGGSAENGEPADPARGVASATMRETLRYGPVWLHLALFFIYTGLEVTAGQWSFTMLTEGRGVAKEAAGLWVSGYWASLCAGRILFGFIVERMGIDLLLRLSLGLALTGAALFFANYSHAASAVGLALLGLGLAPIYPCLMTRTPQRLGSARAAHAIGFQVSFAMVGAAVLPSVSGFLAQRLGLETIAICALSMAAALFLLHEATLASDRRLMGRAA